MRIIKFKEIYEYNAKSSECIPAQVLLDFFDPLTSCETNLFISNYYRNEGVNFKYLIRNKTRCIPFSCKNYYTDKKMEKKRKIDIKVMEDLKEKNQRLKAENEILQVDNQKLIADNEILKEENENLKNIF
ncbi:hypothetical protein ACTFIW_008483 [Dictyostelium discoideum]